MNDELFLEQIACGPMQNFVYAIGSRVTREVLLVDPAWAVEAIVSHVREQGFEPVAALVTHYHPDHVGGTFSGHRIEGLQELLELKGMKVYTNRHEAAGLVKVTGISDSDVVKVDSSGGFGQIYDVESTALGRVDVSATSFPVEARRGSGPKPLLKLFLRARRSGEAALDFAPLRRAGPALLDAEDHEVSGIRFVGGTTVQVDTPTGDPPGQRIGFAPEVLDFGDVGLSASVRKNLRIQNFGFSDLQISGVGSTIPEFQAFACGPSDPAGACASIPPFGFVELPVVFSPTRAGVFSAELAIDSNDAQQPRARVVLLGRSNLTLAVTPRRLEFGKVAGAIEDRQRSDHEHRHGPARADELSILGLQLRTLHQRFAPAAGGAWRRRRPIPARINGRDPRIPDAAPH